MSSGVCHRWLNSCRGRTQSCPLLPLKNAGFSWQKWWFTQQRRDVTLKNCRNLSSKRTYDQTLMFVGKLIHPLVVMQNLPSCVGHHIRRKQDFHIRVGLLAGNHQWGSILYIYIYIYVSGDKKPKSIEPKKWGDAGLEERKKSSEAYTVPLNPV